MEETDRPRPLFVYGTLMDPCVRHAVLGYDVEFERVEAGCCEVIENAVYGHYPALHIGNRECIAIGLLLHISHNDKKILDIYEGRGYCLQNLVVHNESGEDTFSMAYVATGRMANEKPKTQKGSVNVAGLPAEGGD